MLTYDYKEIVDLPNVTETQQRYTTTFNVDAQGVENAAETGMKLNQLSYPGYTSDDNQRMTNTIRNLEEKHNEFTNVAYTLNTLHNMNRFVGNTQRSEIEKMQLLNQKSVNDLYRMREQYRDIMYRVDEGKYFAGFTQLTLFVACAVSFAFILAYSPRHLISPTAAYVVSTTIVVAYGIYSVMHYRYRQRRRRDSWDKFYFGTPVNQN